MRSIKKILCPVDFGDDSSLIAEFANEMAGYTGAAIEVLYVSPILPDLKGEQKLSPEDLRVYETAYANGAKALMDKYIADNFKGRSVTTKVLSGKPAKKISEYIKESNADMVIMGTKSEGVGALFFGSVADKVVRSSPVPVMIVR